MPFKTACSPLKRGASQRFQPSLLAYSDSPMQAHIGFALAFDDTSDVDNNGDGDGQPSDESASESAESECEQQHPRLSPAHQPAGGPRRSVSTSDVASNRSVESRNDDRSSEASSTTRAPRRMSWTRTFAGSARVSIASTLTEAREALQARERSVAASIQRLRRSSSDRQSVAQDAKQSHGANYNTQVSESVDNQGCDTDNQLEHHHHHLQEANQNQGASSTSSQQLHELATIPTESEGSTNQALLAQKSTLLRTTNASALRTRAKSYQSMLSKYLPTIFDHRSAEAKSSLSATPQQQQDQRVDDDANPTDSAALSSVIDRSASTTLLSSAHTLKSSKSIDPTEDTGHRAASRPKRFAQWRRRDRERDNQIGHS